MVTNNPLLKKLLILLTSHKSKKLCYKYCISDHPPCYLLEHLFFYDIFISSIFYLLFLYASSLLKVFFKKTYSSNDAANLLKNITAINFLRERFCKFVTWLVQFFFRRRPRIGCSLIWCLFTSLLFLRFCKRTGVMTALWDKKILQYL